MALHHLVSDQGSRWLLRNPVYSVGPEQVPVQSWVVHPGSHKHVTLGAILLHHVPGLSQAADLSSLAQSVQEPTFVCSQNCIILDRNKLSRPRLQILKKEMLQVSLTNEADAHALSLLKHVMEAILRGYFLYKIFC